MKVTEVVTYSHGFYVKPANDKVKYALIQFCKTLGQWEVVKRPPDWRPQRVLSRIFAGATKDRKEFRFHITLLEEVIRALHGAGVYKDEILVRQMGTPKPVKVNFPLKEELTARDYQEGLIDFLSNPNQKIKVTNLQTGKGKAEALDALVKVPNGWKRMGDMSIGQEVIAWDGTTTKVTGVYPQGKKQLYRVTFADDRSVEVCGEHLWKVYYINTVPHKRWRIVDTVEMLRLISMPNPRVYVPLCESEQNDDVKLPIPPYTLGALLGDGNFTHGSVSLCKDDEEVIESIKGELPEHLDIRNRGNCRWDIVSTKSNITNPIREGLKEMGLMGKASHAKFVPEDYKHASTRQRLSILQGLMDTDGTVNTERAGGSISYCSTSPHLAADVQYLVRSLGGIASISELNPSYTYKGEKRKGRLAYKVNIRFKKQSDLFRLTRKRDRTNDENQYSKNLKLRVKSIEPTTVSEAQCISIEHPDSLYITNDFIVTHNTFCALSAMINIGVRTVIQLRGGYVARWMEDLKGLFNFKKGELLVVRGRDSLQSIINMAKEGELEAKVIVITSKTVYNYLKEFEANPSDNIYGIRPEEFYGLLGVGLRIIDEAHEDYHHNFRTDLYSNVQSSIHLSATLNTEDPFKQRMYDIALPKDSWHEGVKYDAYIGVKAMMYETEDMTNIRTQERGQDMYSHNAYEKSIMKNKKMLESYLRVICYPVFKYYLEDDWKPGQKCLIFCGMVEMCEIVRDYLRKITSEIVINEFVSETDESVLSESDIIVSTVESCGTAQDIPNLKVSVLTRALRKLETNEQVKGRLRKLKKWPEVTPIFVYLVNTSIQKHLDYHEVKKDQFEGKCLYHEEERIPFGIETS